MAAGHGWLEWLLDMASGFGYPAAEKVSHGIFCSWRHPSLDRSVSYQPRALTA
jgi:hypothetical protein